MMTWEKRVQERSKELPAEKGEAAGFREAQIQAICRTVAGVSSHSGKANKDRSTAAVANISSAHVPAFVEASQQLHTTPYKNYYDLGKNQLGDPGTFTKREQVDRCLPLGAAKEAVDYKQVYFCAAELNGAGIPYYGDLCLVLSNEAVGEQTRVLDRNSFDFLRDPFDTRSGSGGVNVSELTQVMKSHSGSWSEDLPNMVAVKALEVPLPRARHVTVRQVSDMVLADEDYLEILKIGSFAVKDLREVRMTSSVASLAASIAERTANGPAPPPAELLWERRNREARWALRRAGCPVKVVTTEGREGR
jgi:hypothetical protein